MAVVSPHRPSVRLILFVPLVLLVGAAWAWRKEKRQEHIELSKNYEVAYDLPKGWKVADHGPETKFRIIDPHTNLVLRGEVNQVIDENNPTPDLDTRGIADYYVKRTEENMPTWKATDLGNFPGKQTDFEVIRRSTKGKVVVSAFATKGNTTVIVTLFGQDKAANLVDTHMDYLNSFLQTVSLHEKDMSNL